MGWDRKEDEIGWEGCPALELLLAISPMTLTLGLWHREAVTWNGCTAGGVGSEWDRWEKGHSSHSLSIFGQVKNY